MAVPTLDLSVLEYFSPILTFILVWVFVFGIFQFSKVFGEEPSKVSILAYDALGLIYYCWFNNNYVFFGERD